MKTKCTLILLDIFLMAPFISFAEELQIGKPIHQFEAKNIHNTKKPLPYPLEQTLNYNTLGISYFSWAEKMYVQSAGVTSQGWASLNGFNFQYENESYSSRKGYRVVGDLFYGQAGTSDTVSGYTATYQAFYGAGLQLHYIKQKTPNVLFSFGPILIYRNLSWPKTSGMTNAFSGADFNYGINFDLKLRLTTKIDVIQSIGGLYSDASTFWSVGMAYKL